MDIEKITVRITESGKNMDVVVLSKHAHRITVVLGEGVHSVKCDLSRVQTNLVFFDLENMRGADFEEECRKRGLLGGATDAHRVRFVTHYGITAEDIQSTLRICDEVLSA